MFTLVAPMLGAFATVVLHVVAWRAMRPASPARLLPAAAVGGAVLGSGIASVWLPVPAGTEALEALLLFGALISTYLISLPALEAESPSSLIVMFVDARRAAGATREELAVIINDDAFVVHRIRGLEADGLVERTDGRLQITPAGRVFLNGFMVYHRLAGRQGVAG